MSIKFTNKNRPTGFYIYLFLRADCTPYYVGKGKGGRAWDQRRGNCTKPPTDKSRIVIIHWDLTETAAFILERYYIRWFGRKDIGTGILRNQTDGGEGATGRKGALSAKYNSIVYTWENLQTRKVEQLTGREMIEKYPEIQPSDISFIKNRGASKHWRLADNDASRKGCHDNAVYQFEHVSSGKRETLTRLALRQKYPYLSQVHLRIMVTTHTTSKGWRRVRDIDDPLHHANVALRPDPRKGRSRPEVTGVNSPTYDPTVYTWIHIESGNVVQMTRNEFIDMTGFTRDNVAKHLRGEQKSCRGWKAQRPSGDEISTNQRCAIPVMPSWCPDSGIDSTT
jgi:hypothetical protein